MPAISSEPARARALFFGGRKARVKNFTQLPAAAREM